MSQQSFQDQGSVMHCFGCGADNANGLQLKSYWDGDEAIAEFHPEPHHCGGTSEIVYGGLLASLIDCHGCNMAIAHLYRDEGRPIGDEPKILCLTVQLNISLLKPTPISKPINLRARIRKVERRKIWVECEVQSGREVTAQGEVLAIRLKEANPA